MNKKTRSRIIALAYLHRYAPVLAFLILPACIRFGIIKTRDGCYIYYGISCIVFGLWSLIGYLLRWRHIYCSDQDSGHNKMTPEDINWSKVSKVDAYGEPIFFFIMGIGAFLFRHFY